MFPEMKDRKKAAADIIRNKIKRMQGIGMIYIGCHLSVTDGYEAMGKTMTGFGGNTFAWFTRNPRGGKSKPVIREDAEALLEYVSSEGFGPLVAHGSYTMNLCSSNEETRKNGFDMLKKDLEIMEMVPGNLYNFHPGSHTGQGTETGIAEIADALNRAMTKDMNTTVLLETMAGKGSEVGGTFEELKDILDRLDHKDKAGVCLDDIVDDLDGVLQRFDMVIGLSKLKAVHFNDCKNERGSHKDRHEKLGKGFIGMDAMKRIAMHPELQNLPFILETPNEDEGYIEEIRTVNNWFQ